MLKAGTGGRETGGLRASMGSIKSFAESLTYALLAMVIGWIADGFGVVPALVSFQVFGVLSLMIYEPAQEG